MQFNFFPVFSFIDNTYFYFFSPVHYQTSPSFLRLKPRLRFYHHHHVLSHLTIDLTDFVPHFVFSYNRTHCLTSYLLRVLPYFAHFLLVINFHNYHYPLDHPNTSCNTSLVTTCITITWPSLFCWTWPATQQQFTPAIHVFTIVTTVYFPVHLLPPSIVVQFRRHTIARRWILFWLSLSCSHSRVVSLSHARFYQVIIEF